MNKKVEILSPAGSYESLKAAIAAGADAVYIGGTRFGARAYANNLTEEELLEAIDYVHLHGRKIYLTINTLLKEHELCNELYDYLLPYYKQGIDAVIVQDIGVLTYIKEQFPDLPIHASTQMTITNVLGAQFLKSLGAERIVTAREMQLSEIEEIAKNANPYNIDYASATASQHWSVTKKIEILRLRACFTSVSIRDRQNLNKVIDRFEVDIPQAILDYMGTSTYTVTPIGDSFNGNIFLIFNNSSNNMATGSYCWIMKIDKDRNATAYKFTNNTNEKLVFRNTQSYRKYYTINGDYLWVVGYDSEKLYGINYSDSTQIIDTGIEIGTTTAFICSVAENLVGIGNLYDNSSTKYRAYSIYDVINRTYKYVNGYEYKNNYMYIPFADKKGVYLKVYDTDGKMEITKDVRYLATINNLAEPVVKTSSKTMKVTYTITEE